MWAAHLLSDNADALHNGLPSIAQRRGNKTITLHDTASRVWWSVDHTITRSPPPPPTIPRSTLRLNLLETFFSQFVYKSVEISACNFFTLLLFQMFDRNLTNYMLFCLIIILHLHLTSQIS